LDYALDNRTEWEAKGHGIVSQLVEDAELKFGEVESPERLIRRTQALRMGEANEDVDETLTNSSAPLPPLKDKDDLEQATCSITSSTTGFESPEESEFSLDNEPPGNSAVAMPRDGSLPPMAIDPSSPTADGVFTSTLGSPNRKKKLGAEARFI
jgi:hypothetical protein